MDVNWTDQLDLGDPPALLELGCAVLDARARIAHRCRAGEPAALVVEEERRRLREAIEPLIITLTEGVIGR